MPNFYQMFKSLLPDAPLLVGVVLAVETGGCVVSLPDGGVVFGRGSATIGQSVFLRDGVIEGIAPNLTVVDIEV
jgi:hypothetical protein